MTAPTDPQIAAVVEGLSEAQRRYLLEARPIFPIGAAPDEAELWATFPPSNTCKVLHWLGLWQWDGCLLPLGLAVRAHLERQDDER